MVTTTRPSSGWLGWWLRWSWRDFRSHWIAVTAIALVLAIGTGVYAGLGSTAEWRRQSNDASFAALAMHDLRVTLSPGTFVEQEALLGAIASIDGADSVRAVTERLVVDSQVDTGVMDGADSVLVPARLVGMTFQSTRPVDDVWVRDGTAPSGDPTDRRAVLEAKFADQHGLPTEGTLVVAGDRTVNYTGLGITPEDFFYEGPQGTVFAAGELAILYLPLAAAQDISGHDGMVNDAALVLVDGADRDAIGAQLTDALSDLGLSATVSTRDDADAVRVLYEDIDNDQRFWNALSALVLFAAALAAFNLINRIVEAQRREIGIGMALGVPRPTTRHPPHAHRRPGRRAGHDRRPRRRVPRRQGLREPPRVVPAAPRTSHTVPVRRVRPGCRTRHRDPDRSERPAGLAGVARRADRGDPHRPPRGEVEPADRLDRQAPAPGFDHDPDADPQRAAHPAPHRADCRRRRRGDHRPGRRPRDARQFRSDTRPRGRRVHQGRRRPGRRPTRHVLPRRLTCRRGHRRRSRHRTRRCRTAATRDRTRIRTRRQPRPPHRVRRSRPLHVDTDDRGRRDCGRRRPWDPAGPQGRRRSGGTGRRHRHAAASDPNRGRRLRDRRDLARRGRYPRQPDPDVRVSGHQRRRPSSDSKVS